MTDSEIIAALTTCHKGNGYSECEKCPYVVTRGCMDILGEDALGLINRQQAELEKVKSEAVREFAEKLKERAFKCPTTITFGFGTEWVKEAVSVIEIDNLVKEMGCDNGDI